MKCSHQVPLHFPGGKGHTSGSLERYVGTLPSGTVLWVSQRWGFVSSEQCPTRGRCWHSCWAPGELKEPHSGQVFIRPQDDWLWPAVSFPPGHNPTRYLLVVLPQRAGTMVPIHLGYDSGKLFTKASKDYCLSFVSHLVWAADVSDWMRQHKYISFTHYSTKIIPFNYSFILNFFHILIKFKLPSNWTLQSARKGLFSAYKTR